MALTALPHLRKIVQWLPGCLPRSLAAARTYWWFNNLFIAFIHLHTSLVVARGIADLIVEHESLVDDLLARW
jgi:hypothetical protein